ncbi:MAG: GNAT family N-acetyltransferase [Proteobacteria bacterium]|nr:GNAT family N-acetyltransferase [Pseudomonadota bacterium]
MSAPPSVRLTQRDESAAMSPVLTDAFVDEAGLNYWLKQGREKERARRKFFDAIVEDAVHPQRDIYVAESGGKPLGAALWTASGRKAFDLSVLKQVSLGPLMLSIAGVGGMQRGFALADKLETYHPKVPHAHLVFLGVATSAQGRGVGSELLKHTLAALDAAGTVAYLECSTERNAALYQRHGFEVTGEFDLPNLHMWTMTRQPRG